MYHTMGFIRRFVTVLFIVSVSLACLSCASTLKTPKIRTTDLPKDANYGDYPQEYKRVVREWLETNIPKPECEGNRCSSGIMRIALDGNVDISEPRRAFGVTQGAGWLVFARTYINEPQTKVEVHHLFFLQGGTVVYHEDGYACAKSGGSRICFEGAMYPGGKAIPNL